MPRPLPPGLKKASQNTILNSSDRRARQPLKQSHYGNRQLIAAYQQNLQTSNPAKKTKKSTVKKNLNQLLLGEDNPKRHSIDSTNSKSPPRQEEQEERHNSGHSDNSDSNLTDSDDDEMVHTRNSTPADDDDTAPKANSTGTKTSSGTKRRRMSEAERRQKKKQLRAQLMALETGDDPQESSEDDEDDTEEDKKIQAIGRGYTYDLTGNNAVLQNAELRVQMEQQGLVLNNKLAKKFINDYVAQKGIRKFKFFTPDMASFNSQIAKSATATKDKNSYFYNATREKREAWWEQWHETYKTAINAKRSNIQNEVAKNWIGMLSHYFLIVPHFFAHTHHLILLISFPLHSAPQGKGLRHGKTAQDLQRID